MTYTQTIWFLWAVLALCIAALVYDIKPRRSTPRSARSGAAAHGDLAGWYLAGWRARESGEAYALPDTAARRQAWRAGWRDHARHAALVGALR
jgi:hypothetical protein